MLILFILMGILLIHSALDWFKELVDIIEEGGVRKMYLRKAEAKRAMLLAFVSLLVIPVYLRELEDYSFLYWSFVGIMCLAFLGGISSLVLLTTVSVWPGKFVRGKAPVLHHLGHLLLYTWYVTITARLCELISCLVYIRQ